MVSLNVYSLLTSDLKRPLKSGLMHFLKILKEWKVYQKQNLRNLSLATKEFYFIFNGKLCKKVNGVAMGPTLTNVFLVTVKSIGYKFVHLTLSLISIGGMLMISMLCLPHQNAFQDFVNANMSFYNCK